MNSEKFSVQSTLEANYLNVKLEEPIELDEIAMKVLKEDCPEFLLPYRLTTVNDCVTLKYRLINSIALKYANLTMDKKSFVQLYMNLLTPFVKGRDWFLDYHNICVDPSYVYLDKHADKVYFIYIPEKNSQNTNEEILEFFKKVFTDTRITDDKDFQVRLFRYFTSDSITLMGLYQIFQEEIGKPASPSGGYGGVSGTSAGGFGGASGASAGGFGGASGVSAGGFDGASGSGVGGFGGASGGSDGGFGGVSGGATGGFGGLSGKAAGIFGGVGAKQEKTQQEEKGSGSKNFLDGLMKKKETEPKKKKDTADSLFGNTDDFLKSLENNNDFDIFGSGSGKKKDKEKKVKENEVPKKGLFGKKKENEPVQTSGQEQVSAGGWNQSAGGAGGWNHSSNGSWDASNMFQTGEMSDETDISGGESSYVSACLELIDSPIPGAMRRINLDFPGEFVTIGRMSSDQVKPDIAFPGDFKRIGRQHARIERRGGVYYIIDLGSANHTLINGRIMAPNQPYPLQDGMEVTFTDSKPVSYRVRL